MRKGMDLINMPVVADDGEEIDRVRGIVLNPSQMHVMSLLLNTDVDTRKVRVMRLHDVRSIGESNIEVSSPGVVRSVDFVPDIRLVLYPHGPMTGTKLLTCDGTAVGTVNDIVFDECTGQIDFFEISKESCPNAFFERSEIHLLEELNQGMIVHASIIKELADEISDNTQIDGQSDGTD